MANPLESSSAREWKAKAEALRVRAEEAESKRDILDRCLTTAVRERDHYYASAREAEARAERAEGAAVDLHRRGVEFAIAQPASPAKTRFFKALDAARAALSGDTDGRKNNV